MYIRKCAICGRDFEARTTQKYCSDMCRIEGTKLARKEWEERTGFREKHRHAMELFRAKQTEEEFRQQRKEERKNRVAIKLKNTIAKNKREAELQEKANAGDPWARMQTADSGIEYWKAYADYCKAWDQTCTRKLGEQTVNGISVYEPDFPERVVESRKLNNKTVHYFMWYHNSQTGDK